MSIDAAKADTGNIELSTSRSAVNLRGFLWAGAAVAIFSGWFVVTRFSVTHNLRVWDVTALRFGIGAILLLPVLLLPGSRPPARAWAMGLVFALLWGFPFVLMVAYGLQLTSAAEASSITPALMPVFAGLIAWAVLAERPSAVKLCGYAAIVAGLIGLVVTNASASLLPSPAGIAVLIAASVMWASYTILFRNSGLTPLQSAALICFWSAVLYMPVFFALGLSRLGNAPTGELWLQVIYQGCLMSAVAIVAFNRAVSLLGAGAATAIIALIPVVTTAIAAPSLGEFPPLGGLLAIGVISLGVCLVARPQALKVVARSNT